MSIQTVFLTLGPLTGGPFWSAYHAMDAGDQQIADGELQLDAWFCGWTPGPDTWIPPIVLVPPPIDIPPIQSTAVPEIGTWLMLLIGCAMVGARMYRRGIA